MDITWLSANKFGYELLKEALTLDNVNITSIITPGAGAATVMYDGIEKERWYDFNMDVFEVDNLTNEKELLGKIFPDLVIMCGWRRILDKTTLNIPQHGFIGFHPSLLPKGRGPAPIINLILNGFEKSGVTMFHVSEGLDDGDIIGQEKFTILEADHAEEVYNKVIDAGRKLIRTFLPVVIQGKAPRIPQDKSQATVFKKPCLNDNRIDLEEESLEVIYRKIKALSKPYEGAYIEKNGKRLIIWRAELEG